MLKASLGFMLGFGVRPRALPGHHLTIIGFAEKNLGEEHRGLTGMFNRMRRKRHQSVYDVIGFISKHEAQQAFSIAGRYLTAIRDEICRRNPQAKLL